MLSCRCATLPSLFIEPADGGPVLTIVPATSVDGPSREADELVAANEALRERVAELEAENDDLRAYGIPSRTISKGSFIISLAMQAIWRWTTERSVTASWQSTLVSYVAVRSR